ncbi:CHRD domain-containing protein [Erythrobacter sanguineus]|uniref:CHRD domain-containing protein n=1 Tax=Erythrobacter sanguineus TaxID=198312 RepID=A0A1M7SYF0_9SPHN|nr:CHRD domain-containing protein [Erythrobacter sanguineus]SHN63555.1 CHRD domain-containing protein [Erythrobacter sanguineus]
MKKRSLLAAVLTGAIALSACATLEEGIAEETAKTYYATLTGRQVIGGGDPDGAARAEITVSDELDQICWDLNNVANIVPITAAHIHRGAQGTNGPPVFTLKRANEGGYKGCSDALEWTGDRIENNPELFYVNAHTARYPDGAIRGQLRD